MFVSQEKQGTKLRNLLMRTSTGLPTPMYYNPSTQEEKTHEQMLAEGLLSSDGLDQIGQFRWGSMVSERHVSDHELVNSLERYSRDTGWKQMAAQLSAILIYCSEPCRRSQRGVRRLYPAGQQRV